MIIPATTIPTNTRINTYTYHSSTTHSHKTIQ
nr:MAG TPA: hypothetical protein [Caudoviricetes sp.]